MSNKRILLLGATGRTGKLALEQAIARGYQVNCLVRKPEKVKLQNDAIELFEGDTRSEEDLNKAIKRCDAIISVLNISRKSDFPWSPLRTSIDFLSTTMNQVIKVANQNGIKRIVLCSAWGVAETEKDLPAWFRWFINNSNIGVAYKDHGKQEALLEASKMDWTIVRPSGLTNSRKVQQLIESTDNHPKPKLTISRLSVAKYMLSALSNDSLIGSKVVLSAK